MPAAWAQARTVGSGWDRYAFVFAGGGGVLYAVESNGTLVWRRHLGHLDGSPRWSEPSTVGSGWGRYRALFGGGLGDVYAVDAASRLVHLRHLGHQDGTFRWSAPAELGRVDDPRRVFAILPLPGGSGLR